MSHHAAPPLPAGQVAEHETAPASLKEAAAQGAHAAAPGMLECVPAAHGLQLVVEDAKKPAGQAAHTVEPFCGAMVPGPHGVQDARPGCAVMEPAMHALQAGEFAAAEKKPEGQKRHWLSTTKVPGMQLLSASRRPRNESGRTAAAGAASVDDAAAAMRHSTARTGGIPSESLPARDADDNEQKHDGIVARRVSRPLFSLGRSRLVDR